MFSEQLLGLPVQLTVPIEPRVPCAGGVMTVKVRASPSGSEPVRVITRGVSSFVDTILESAVGAWLFWIVTVVVAEPVLVAESVKQMRIVLAPTLRRSEERRVGKECRTRRARYREKRRTRRYISR